MTGSAIMTEIVTILISGLQSIGQGIGTALNDMVNALFITTPSGGTAQLSVFASVLVVFAGIALGLGLVRWVINFLASFGQRNR